MMTKIEEKNTAEKKLSYLQLTYRPKVKEKHSAIKREHLAIQKIEIVIIFHFCWSFLPS
jgi:hypothetical protein